MSKKFDLNAMIGKKFGRLMVLSISTERNNAGSILLDCQCQCGAQCRADAPQLHSGKKSSCGCIKAEKVRRNAIRHGQAGHGINRTPTYRSWRSMMTRCTNPKSQNWRYYGAKGVSVCERWKSFEAFIEDVGERPYGTSLDRYPNNNGNYEPGNVRWATRIQQRNNRRDS